VDGPAPLSPGGCRPAEVVWKDGNQSGLNFIPAELVLERMVGKGEQI
jgi:hypothetical protein